MDEDIIINESTGTPVKKGSRWLVTIAKPGKGASGFYPEAVLKESGPKAFPPGTKAFFNHDSKRDIRDMVGTYKDGAFWNDEAGELQGYLTPFPRYAQVLEEAGENVEASIHALSTKDITTGYVKALLPDRANTVDLVSFAGLEGSGLKYQVESLFAAAAADGEDGKENQNMEITKEMWDGMKSDIAAGFAKFDTFVAESKAEIKGQADADAVETAVATRVAEALTSYDERVEAIDKADILTVQKEALKERARKGEDVSEDLAAAVSFVAEARKELVPDTKRDNRGNVVVVDESHKTDTPKTFTPARWSN